MICQKEKGLMVPSGEDRQRKQHRRKHRRSQPKRNEAKMRYVEVPQPIQIKNLTTGEPLTVDGSDAPWRMARYLTDIVLPDSAMGKGYEVDRVRTAVCEAFKDAKPGDCIAVEDGHYDMVSAAIREPAADISATVMMQLFPFQLAFVESSREKPKVLAELTG